MSAFLSKILLPVYNFSNPQGNEGWFEKIGSSRNRGYLTTVGNDFWFQNSRFHCRVICVVCEQWLV